MPTTAASTDKPLVVIGLIGPTLDTGQTGKRWERWRPTVSIAQHPTLPVARQEILYQSRYQALFDVLSADITAVSPETTVRGHIIEMADPWDFEAVFAALHDFARAYPFRPDAEDYLVHITTGTHVAQICLFLLTESRHFPARLLQTNPARGAASGSYTIIDLDLSRYDRLAARFSTEAAEGRSFLKSGIDTRNTDFNRLIERIEIVAGRTTAPILLTGPTGAGKSRLARRIYELKHLRNQVQGGFVEINCATLRGDAAMSTLFGHVKGAFTGALADRRGLLREADGGVLFLDEIGELGPDEQAMLLRAIEEGVFRPMGADREVKSRFQLIAGTNRNLSARVAAGRFREDLLARLAIWHFHLPGLAERPEDIEPNLDYELEQATTRLGRRISFNREARQAFVSFALRGRWTGNFRELNAAVTRMATLAQGRIGLPEVEEEVRGLQRAWSEETRDSLAGLLSPDALADLDRFDRVQLVEVVAVCRRSASLSEAGRTLFAASRAKKTSANDADRLRKYLARFDLDWDKIKGA